MKQINYRRSIRLITVILLFNLAFIVFSTISAVSADSSVIYVNTTGNDLWDGQSAIWTGKHGPKLTIKNATGTVTEGGTVNIANGIYSGNGNTNVLIDRNMTITGQSQTNTIINGTNKALIFQIQNNVNVTIQHLTFANGYSDYSGAIYNNGSNLNLIGCTFIGNTLRVSGSYAEHGGGAIYNIGNLNVIDSTFTNNSIKNRNTTGGAISNSGNLTVTGSNFINNTAIIGIGGAIYNTGTLVAHFNRFVGNIANLGSDIYNSNIADAELNWWGDNSNPSTKIGGFEFEVTNWLILTLTAYPDKMSTGNTSHITADLTHDSSGGVHNPALGHLPDGIPVLFTTTLGSIISNALTSNGAAVVTLNGGLIPGIAVVNAAVDNQTVTTNVNIQGWKRATYTYSIFVPVLKWYKFHGKWKAKYVYVKSKKWYKSGHKWKYKWVNIKKYKKVYKTGQKWVLT